MCLYVLLISLWCKASNRPQRAMYISDASRMFFTIGATVRTFSYTSNCRLKYLRAAFNFSTFLARDNYGLMTAASPSVSLYSGRLLTLMQRRMTLSHQHPDTSLLVLPKLSVRPEKRDTSEPDWPRRVPFATFHPTCITSHGFTPLTLHRAQL